MTDSFDQEGTADVQLETLKNMGRRRMARRAGALGLAAAAAAGGLLGSASPALATNQGAGASDADILNFALNLEYLEAQFYLFAVTGSGLPANMQTGVGTQGTTGPGTIVPFKTLAIAQYAQKLAMDEQTHVRVLRGALGSAAVAIPYIDVGVGVNNAFSVVARAAGLISAGQIFNPYADELSFLLAASIFEDVGVTAYAGAARYIGNPDYVEAAGAILAVEAYHGGAIRGLLANLGAQSQFNMISTLRGTLSAAGIAGAQGEQPLSFSGQSFNFAPVDANALAFRRNPRQVLNIVYGAVGASNGGFFPQGMNGNIKS